MRGIADQYRRLRLRLLGVAGLVAVAVLVSASAAPALPPPNVVCGGSCDSGGGVWVGGWCSNVGAYNITTTVPHYTVRCLPNHTWWYA